MEYSKEGHKAASMTGRRWGRGELDVRHGEALRSFAQSQLGSCHDRSNCPKDGFLSY